jgi:hypothetical protein
LTQVRPGTNLMDPADPDWGEEGGGEQF